MRHIAVIAVALAGTVLATPAFAQISAWSVARDSGRSAHEVHLNVFGAFARPLGDFSSTTSSKAAFAMPGAGLGLDLSVRFSHDIETGVMLLVDRNPTDSGALGAAITAALRSYGLPTEPLVVSATQWQITWGLVKAGYAPQVGRRLHASVDVYAGGLFGRHPELKLVAAPSNASVSPGTQPWVALAAGVGAGLRWHDHLTLDLLYLSDATEPFWPGPYPIFRRPVPTLHLTLGFSFGH